MRGDAKRRRVRIDADSPDLIPDCCPRVRPKPATPRLSPDGEARGHDRAKPSGRRRWSHSVHPTVTSQVLGRSDPGRLRVRTACTKSVQWPLPTPHPAATIERLSGHGGLARPHMWDAPGVGGSLVPSAPSLTGSARQWSGYRHGASIPRGVRGVLVTGLLAGCDTQASLCQIGESRRRPSSCTRPPAEGCCAGRRTPTHVSTGAR